MPESSRSEYLSNIGISTAIPIGLYLCSLYSYLLFHSLVEIVTIAVAFILFILTLNTRKYLPNNYLKLLGIGYAFIALIDLLHTLAYKGMNLFPGYGSNLPTQLWISARYLQALTLCVAPLLIGRRAHTRIIFVGYTAVASLLLAIIYSGNFPDCFIEGEGLTPFKIGSEYVISFILLISLYLLYRKRNLFNNRIYLLLLSSITCTVISEISFTAYASVYGVANMIGHLAKLAAFYFIYRAILVTGLKEPFELVFKNLKDANDELCRVNINLEHEIEERTCAENELILARNDLEMRVEERTAALQASEERFKSLADTSPLAICATAGVEQKVTYMNLTFFKLFGYSLDEIQRIDQWWPLAYPDENYRILVREEWTKRVTQAINTHTEIEPMEVEVTCKDGSLKQILWEFKTIGKEDWGFGLDLTERKRAEEERKKLEDQLLHSQKLEAVGTLAGGIAHDFNNILTAIVGYGQLTLMKIPHDDPVRRNVEHMLESAERAATLTQSLLAFSRKQISERKPVELNTIIRKVEKFLLRVIGEDVAIHLTLAEQEFPILADAGQLEQVFMNLATNARDAMPHGGSFMIKTSCVELDGNFITADGYGKPGSYVTISVADTGTGMNEETKEKIFEPFFTTKEVGKGSGLGLAMAYGIINQHEGFINVYSEPGKGTTLHIYLPLINSSTIDGEKKAEEPYPQGGTETILLAEDDPHLQPLSVLILEQMGYKVITASNGEEAVAKFMENRDKIQLLLLDIMMPKKSGREAADEIRMVDPTVPVIFISGYSSELLREKGLIEEDAAMINKPMTPNVLLKKVREILDKEWSSEKSGMD
ncbi:MAG: response regulator [Geobacteraceae bacterium]|nr:response regulator [Geobacteraceae bacterium]